MDEVLAQFMTTMIDPENEQYRSSFDGMYKNWGRLSHQEQRRKDLLDVQRSTRRNKVDACRGILDIVNSVEDKRLQNQNTFKSQNYRPTIYVAGFTKVSASYKNVLMLSEWLVERPEDFENNWCVVACPKGVRTLVVARQGITKCYNKYGSFKMSCSTALPGGHPGAMSHKNQCVVLDCFHVEENNTMYILDLLAWNSQPMTDGETEFRHFWLRTHFDDIPELKRYSEKNQVVFEVLPKVDCKPESFNKFMMTYPHFENSNPPLDGLLFYHKLAHYVAGETPLVGWLYPYMVREVLGADIEVHPEYVAGRPAGYICQAQFIQQFDRNQNIIKKQPVPKVPYQISPANPPSQEQRAERLRKQKKRRSIEERHVSDNGMDAESTPAFMFQMSQVPFGNKPRLTRILPSAEPTLPSRLFEGGLGPNWYK